MTIDADLARLADAHGVATRYLDSERRPVTVAPDAVTAVLAELGVDTSTPEAIRRALSAGGAEPAAAGDTASAGRRTVVVPAGQPTPVDARGTLVEADGDRRPVDGEVGAEVPPGWYRLDGTGTARFVVVTPPAPARPDPGWGWMVQLYALHSPASWGLGDLGDLRELVRRSARELGAGAVLCNPLHAVTPTGRIQPSPYSPSSRRFVNPLYLRLADTAEYARATPEVRAAVDALRPGAANPLDYDAVWSAKHAALELLWPLADPTSATEVDGTGDAGGDPGTRAAERALTDFATFCALAERHGADWREWPAELRHPGSPDVAKARRELAGRVAFHAWAQGLCDRQLDAVRDEVAAAGMPVGVVHDLAVGVDPAGADAWMLQDVLAGGVHVGAPPDAFNQRGQDWGLPPWRPDRLDATGYAPYREMISAVLRRGNGIRIDHVAGLFRLWWIPPGADAAGGTYVRYDAAAMMGVLSVEAWRHHALVVGEDLGTVEPEVTETLADRHMLGCQVLWFARDKGEGNPLRPPARWPPEAAASIATHDLPTAAGFLAGEQVTVRDRLGLLTRPVAEERARADRDRAELLDLLRAEGLLTAAEPTATEAVLAMHALLARTPCRLLLASPYDVLGDRDQPNLPGTVDQYPNWRLPLPADLDALLTDPRTAEVARLLRR